MLQKPSRVPKHCLHRVRGKATCRICGKMVYLSDHDMPESRKAFARILAELTASPVPNIDPRKALEGPTIFGLSADHLDNRNGHYRKTGLRHRHEADRRGGAWRASVFVLYLVVLEALIINLALQFAGVKTCAGRQFWHIDRVAGISFQNHPNGYA
jgi:hypothetical protein